MCLIEWKRKCRLPKVVLKDSDGRHADKNHRPDQRSRFDDGGSAKWHVGNLGKNPVECHRHGYYGSENKQNIHNLEPGASGSWRRSFSQKGSSCLVPVNRGARPEHLAHRPANHPEAGGLRHPRIATLGRFLRRNRWLGHPQLVAETASYWSWFFRRPRFQRNSFLRKCPVASGLAPSPATQPCPGRMTHQRPPQTLGPEPLVLKGLQLQLHFWDRNRILRGCHGHVTLLPSIPGRALDQNHHQPRPTKTN